MTGMRLKVSEGVELRDLGCELEDDGCDGNHNGGNGENGDSKEFVVMAT